MGLKTNLKTSLSFFFTRSAKCPCPDDQRWRTACTGAGGDEPV